MKRFVLGFAAVVVFVPATLAGEAALYPTKDCGKETAQMALNQCTGDNLAAADSALAGLYRKLLAIESDPKAKEQFKDIERAWVAYKDKQCQWETAGDEGGSIWTMEYNQCEIDKTDARIRELQKAAGCTGSVNTCKPQ